MSLRACLVLYVGVGPACRLYRSDGSQVFSDEEHAERLGKLTEGLREKAEAVAASLEAALEDPKAAKRAQGLKEAASESRRVAREAKTRLSELDGTGDAARERQRAATQRAF